MLIQFNVKNWRSIRDEQNFSTIMAIGDEMLGSNTFKPKAPGTSELLRSTAIYGANASGKSNLLNALKTMKSIVVKSALQSQRGDDLPVIPFLLDSETEKAPTEFEVMFIAQDIRYQYGFSATSERIIQEWLLAYPLGRCQWPTGLSHFRPLILSHFSREKLLIQF